MRASFRRGRLKIMGTAALAFDPDFGDDRPLFSTEARVDELRHRKLSLLGHDAGSISVYRRDTPNHGLTAQLPPIDQYMAVYHLRDMDRHIQFRNGKAFERPPTRGGQFKFYDLRETFCSELNSPFHTVTILFPQKLFDRLADENHASRVLEMPWLNGEIHDDPVFAGLVQSVLPSLSTDDVADNLFVDQIFQAMAVHFVRSHAEMRAHSRLVIGGFAPRQERLAKDFIMSRLDGNITVEQIAIACGLSAPHFSRAFRESVGVSPYRWLIEQRVERAKGFLRSTDLTLSDISLACGFSSQSHFTKVFSGQVGVTPAVWRRESKS